MEAVGAEQLTRRGGELRPEQGPQRDGPCARFDAGDGLRGRQAPAPRPRQLAQRERQRLDRSEVRAGAHDDLGAGVTESTHPVHQETHGFGRESAVCHVVRADDDQREVGVDGQRSDAGNAVLPVPQADRRPGAVTVEAERMRVDAAVDAGSRSGGAGRGEQLVARTAGSELGEEQVLQAVTDAEGGDDVLVSGAGLDRYQGMLGFDWVTHKNDPEPADDDLTRTALVVPAPGGLRDRFDTVEGLSGGNQDDILRGDSETAATMVGHELDADAATIVPIWQEKRLVLAGPDITGLQHLQGSSGVWRLWELSRL